MGFRAVVARFAHQRQKKKVLLTGGKLGIFDALQLDNGNYQYSFDLGLQQVVTKFDPSTGAKTIAVDAIPESGKTIFTCPSSHGARNWMPTAFSPKTATLYIPFMESCMKVRDPLPGDFTFGGLGQIAYPRPDSDGNFGGVRAVNPITGKTLWSDRRRAIPATGILATAGDLVFAGYLDREFIAYEAASGKILWRAGLNDVPSGGPISFMVDGKQYVAVITGHGDHRNFDRSFASPEIKVPDEVTATIWVFALPEKENNG